jgi:hypothetical protein
VSVFRELTHFAFEWYSLFKMVTLLQSKINTMLTAFFDEDGLVHHEFVPWDHSMNHTVYKTVLQCFQDAVHQKLPHPNFFQYLDSSPEQYTFPSGPDYHCCPSCGFTSTLVDMGPVTSSCFPG